MRRVVLEARADWQTQVERLGFAFHTIDGATYWDERAAYAFTLEEIERDIEAPTEAIEQLCFAFIEKAIGDDAVLTRLAIPEAQWAFIRESWQNGERNLYGRLDLAYDGRGPAKLLEYNADTPTALFESSVVQWDWLEQAMANGRLPAGCDQFNSLHERLIAAFAGLRAPSPYRLHLACVQESVEDKGTVDYLLDCAKQAGLDARFSFIEEIGLLTDGRFCDGSNVPIETLFKLYPWEWLFRERYASALAGSRCQFIEPPWKALLSNKGLLACLWEMEPGHPNLLPAFFEGDPRCESLSPRRVRKPLYSREGANITLLERGKVLDSDDGPYGAEGFILQDAATNLFQSDGNYAVIGSWLVASQACGLCIREDVTPITKNTSRFLPHYIEP
ncbi:glutathionylspermidine synthase family protein [Bosea sp. 685]|uniref:glutathionylspermidine synthase family protein n=1 Tax=Bosea sp. 685 TaxID=3080057 RepID=UPI002892BC91|nr:glutathionylspermidine synthase family protein [Bosea sp. 685]WNJ93319.1 glutathionylspermidine synthase family protein [Bosea sp. 685]